MTPESFFQWQKASLVGWWEPGFGQEEHCRAEEIPGGFLLAPQGFRARGQVLGNWMCVSRCCIPAHHQSVQNLTACPCFCFMTILPPKATKSCPHASSIEKQQPTPQARQRAPAWPGRSFPVSDGKGRLLLLQQLEAIPSPPQPRQHRAPHQQHQAQPGHPNTCDTSPSEARQSGDARRSMNSHRQSPNSPPA